MVYALLDMFSAEMNLNSTIFEWIKAIQMNIYGTGGHKIPKKLYIVF